MKVSQILIVLALGVILGVPFILRPASESRTLPEGVHPLVIVTPHVPQIQEEFSRGFDRWHKRVHGSSAHIDWRQPGGTSDIMKVLDAAYAAEAAGELARRGASSPQSNADPTLTGNDLISHGSMAIDIMLGGGSYEHGQLKSSPTQVRFRAWKDGPTPISVSKPPQVWDALSLENVQEFSTEIAIDGAKFRVVIPVDSIRGGAQALRPFLADAKALTLEIDLSRVERVFGVQRSVPAGFPQSQLDEWFGQNRIGAQTLYEPEQYWIGTALSGFGIVYNKEVLARLGVGEPGSFRDMADPRLQGWVTLADPRQSGSAATSLDAILSREGWEKGWRLLRDMCANTRSFTNSSPKPPIDVSHGEAAMGLAIDFYGRGQGQAVTPPGGDLAATRVGYVDPKGETYIDADPVTILRGGPNPELARRFVEFCLSDEGQALWQFPATDSEAGKANPRGPDGMAMGPVRHELRRMPVRRAMYEKYLGSFIDRVNPFDLASDALPAGWRSALPIMMGAFAIDNARDLREAWRALNVARVDRAFPPDRLAEMESLFYSFPTTPGADGTALEFTKENYKAISARWKEPTMRTRCEIDYTTFFRENYRRVVALGGEAAN
ncbi:hypothetical protein PHYC_01283 [Phycisphaerales bacterium]|nr:hypothetical protein PHYC_01283 [Phycisphaerales bacterium]